MERADDPALSVARAPRLAECARLEVPTRLRDVKDADRAVKAREELVARGVERQSVRRRDLVQVVERAVRCAELCDASDHFV